MNKGGGEKARAAREGGRGGGRVAPARPKKGAPKVPTPAPSGALQILNVRVAVPGEPPPLPPRRAAPPRDFAAADADEARDPSSLKDGAASATVAGSTGWVWSPVPPRGWRRCSARPRRLRNFCTCRMKSRRRFPSSCATFGLGAGPGGRGGARADAARAARADAALTAPARVDAPAEGLRLDWRKRETRRVRILRGAFRDSPRLRGRRARSARSARGARGTLGARAAREAFHRDEQARVRREKADRRESVVRRLTNAGRGSARAGSGGAVSGARCAFDFRELRSELETTRL